VAAMLYMTILVNCDVMRSNVVTFLVWSTGSKSVTNGKISLPIIKLWFLCVQKFDSSLLLCGTRYFLTGAKPNEYKSF